MTAITDAQIEAFRLAYANAYLDAAGVRRGLEAAQRAAGNYDPLPAGNARAHPQPTQGPYQMNFTSIFQIFSVFQTVVSALEAIAKSDAAMTIEQVISQFISHNTPNLPNSPALTPQAPSAQHQAAPAKK